MRLAVLASGSGTILDAMAEEGLPVSLVLLDRPCKAEMVAAKHKLTCNMAERNSFGADFDRHGYTKQVTDCLAASEIELVAMAGFGTVLGQPIHDAFGGRILNTHPSLLPAFPGWHAVNDALAYGVKITGCTVHVATIEVDSGPILAQQAVPVEANDTVDTLHSRIKQAERPLYVRTLQEIIQRGHVL
ncbi:MAG: phosphoribosylglycinamide formyltransferase [bacterium]|nr:phosphoribosylglycinamide formyltransferase [bacterium]